MADDNNTETPLIQLFIRASTIDRERKGSCPLCQQWFMAACILTEQKKLSFQVTIVDAESPPKSFIDLTGGRKFPVVYGIQGSNNKGEISGLLANTIDEVEQFFDDFHCPDLKRTSEVLAAMTSFKDLYQAFNLFLSSDTKKERLTAKFELLNQYLESTDKRYLVRDWLTYADCYLMPKLHHIKVAAKEYKNYEIPENLFYVWRYIYHMYDTLAFEQTCCTDQDIVKHYQAKANCPPLRGKPSLQNTTMSFDVPASVMDIIKGGGAPLEAPEDDEDTDMGSGIPDDDSDKPQIPDEDFAENDVAEHGDAQSDAMSESSSVQEDGSTGAQVVNNHDTSYDSTQ